MNRYDLRYGALALVALGIAALTTIALPATLAAQAGGGWRVASATVHAGGVDLRPEVAHAGGVVTISGNALVFQQPVEAGASPSIGLFDPEGQLLPDGVYTWELQLFPDARTAKKLRAAARENGGIAPGAWQRQTGTFAIRNGLVAAADLIEAGPAPRAPTAGAALPVDLAAPFAARGPALDDDAAVGTREGVEAGVRAALQGRPEAAAAGRSLPERSDAAALALGASPERRADAAGGPDAQPTRRSVFDNTENGANGRDRSKKR